MEKVGSLKATLLSECKRRAEQDWGRLQPVMTAAPRRTHDSTGSWQPGCSATRPCWTIEIVFRFFKHVLDCRHMLSDDEHGIEIQTYCAIIACS